MAQSSAMALFAKDHNIFESIHELNATSCSSQLGANTGQKEKLCIEKAHT